jgi:hypothetical protein
MGLKIEITAARHRDLSEVAVPPTYFGSGNSTLCLMYGSTEREDLSVGEGYNTDSRRKCHKLGYAT